MKAACLLVALFACGCSTEQTFREPYENVLRAVDATFATTEAYRVIKEPLGEDRCVYDIKTSENAWHSLASAGPTSIDVRRMGPYTTLVAVQVMRQGSISAQRDEGQEKDILRQIAQRLGRSPQTDDE
jgi:hypothetical protein